MNALSCRSQVCCQLRSFNYILFSFQRRIDFRDVDLLKLTPFCVDNSLPTESFNDNNFC